MNENVFVVVDFEGERHAYIAVDVLEAIMQHSQRTGDSNVAGAFLYGNDYVSTWNE